MGGLTAATVLAAAPLLAELERGLLSSALLEVAEELFGLRP